ncbi:helix-turn-helix domain-containing protein [Actinomadura sp. DC4]|uniref:helix-turn-helix domain-containing protein n=1 Tax=Actinomadura sp. DC4 TaxID=3055069 RepID=UPI0025AFEAE6|nr:helix-turn-helix domain-containing protein [Actinomadura sp. DC4]MDN3357405.1 helix-turn-helix domain-containing protein [Actinomadura sp. DC4]
MSSPALVMERADVTPPARLRPLVAHYSGYRYEGLPPGTHLGLPSPYLTVVISLGEPTRTVMPDRRRSSLAALAGGMHMRAALIEHDGDQYGVQLALTPGGARSLFGLPAGELAGVVVPLDEVLTARAGELIERMAGAPSWPARFAILDEVLSRQADRLPDPPDELRHAWRLLTARGGGVRVDELAREVGWSRRHLGGRFTAEYGLTPKEAARVMRFERSTRMLRRTDRPSFADVAARCGFYDQAHLAREWNDFVGCPPSAWLTGQDLPFIQDGEEVRAASSGHE